MENRKRCMITGIGGSIASHFLAHFMHNTDWHIVGLDSFRHKGWTDRIKVMLDAHPEWKDRLTVVTHDLMAPVSPIMRDKIGRIDYLINMASLSDVEASIQDPVPFIINNVWIALNMLEYAREVKPDVFIQISTDEVYGASSSKYGDLRKEWDPLIPSNPYAASKAAQESIAISYWRTYNVPVIITNTMNNFGEMQQSSKFPAMIQKWISENKKITIHGREGQIGSRSYIHSRNFADAVLHILTKLPPHMHVPNSADRPDRYNIAGDLQLGTTRIMGWIAPNYSLLDGKHPSRLRKVWRIPLNGSRKIRPG
jgi:dTDP-glucose 4,6-dehydratase